MSIPLEPRSHSRQIGELCLGGDWACAHGDLSTLRHIAEQLAGYAPEPLHCDLQSLAELCRSDPDRAVAEWGRLKEELYQHPGSIPT